LTGERKKEAQKSAGSQKNKNAQIRKGEGHKRAEDALKRRRRARFSNLHLTTSLFF
jgi:hypothetical protein